MAEGVNRWLSSDQIGLQKDTERYRKMQWHFDAIGPAGREMMRRTASLQICLDLLPGHAGIEQWRLLNLSGPALSAAFTNQRNLAGLKDPEAESRARIWQAVDASRTGFKGRQIGGNRARAYLDFALSAEVLPLDAGEEEASPFRASLAQWLASGKCRPTPADLKHHLTTLFPPVRPRGHYLEVRYLDALPLPWLAVPICLLATLVGVPGARHEALERLQASTLPLGEQWRRSASQSLHDAVIGTTAEALSAIALAHMDALPKGYLPAQAATLTRAYRDQFLRAGYTPADDASEIVSWPAVKESTLCAWQ